MFQKNKYYFFKQQKIFSVENEIRPRFMSQSAEDAKKLEQIAREVLQEQADASLKNDG